MATIHQILTKSNTVGVTIGAGTVYPSCATQYTVFNWVHVAHLIFCIGFNSILFPVTGKFMQVKDIHTKMNGKVILLAIHILYTNKHGK
jgi:uncharacterized membrane protein YagU involved in acid resistance